MTDSTETKVERKFETLNKTGEQVIISGKPENRVKYTVVINPFAEDLCKGTDVLEVNDILKTGQKLHPAIDLESISLYEFDLTKEDNKGELIEDGYKFKYFKDEMKLWMEIPDEQGLVLEYEYEFNPNFVEGFVLENSILLEGYSSSENKLALHEMESSAIAVKKMIKIYKVDEENFKETLPGTEFKLEYLEDGQWKTKYEEIKVNENGYIAFYLSGKNKELKEGFLYRLVETKAVKGYELPEKPMYFELNGITGHWEGEKVHNFDKEGGIEYITNKKEEKPKMVVIPQTGGHVSWARILGCMLIVAAKKKE